MMVWPLCKQSGSFPNGKQKNYHVISNPTPRYMTKKTEYIDSHRKICA